MLENTSKEIKLVTEESRARAEAAPRGKVSPWRGLLWAEWFAHSRLLLIFLALWLAGVWALPLFAQPGWILLLGGIYALLAGPAYGGADVLEGCEEFVFSLPPTRAERYWARVIVGAGTFFVLTTINLFALGLDLPYVLARLYIDTGLIQPLPVLKPGLLYGLVVAFPFAIFAFSFALSAATHSRWLVVTAWFWGGLGALIVLQLGFWYEDLAWESLTGFFSFPLLMMAGAAGFVVGDRLYRRKEIGRPLNPLTLPGHWWLWIALFLLGVCLALALIVSLARHYPRFFAGS